MEQNKASYITVLKIIHTRCVKKYHFKILARNYRSLIYCRLIYKENKFVIAYHLHRQPLKTNLSECYYLQLQSDKSGLKLSH